MRDVHQQMLAYRSSLIAMKDAVDLQWGETSGRDIGLSNLLRAERQMEAVAWHNASLSIYQHMKQVIDKDFKATGIDTTPFALRPKEEVNPPVDAEAKAAVNPELPQGPEDGMVAGEMLGAMAGGEQESMHSLGYRDNETVQVPEPQFQYDPKRHDFVSVRAPMSQRSAQGQGSKRGTVQPDYAAMNQRIQTASVKREPFEEFRNNLYAEMMVQGVNLERSQANHVLNHTAQIFDSMAESLGMSIDDFMGNGKFNVSFRFVDNPRDGALLDTDVLPSTA